MHHLYLGGGGGGGGEGRRCSDSLFALVVGEMCDDVHVLGEGVDENLVVSAFPGIDQDENGCKLIVNVICDSNLYSYVYMPFV